jgi:CRP/FNR family transcriptional regulator
MTDTLIAALRPLGVSKRIDSHATLFHAGDPANGFYVVLSGEIRLFKMDEHGKEIEISRMHAGQFLGEIILFAANCFPVNAIATKKTELLFFEKLKILNAIENNPDIAQGLLTLLARKCLALNQIIEQLALTTVRQRLCTYLLHISAADDLGVIHLPTTKTDLANKLGTIPETLSRTLKQLQADKLIAVDGRQITLLDRKKLRSELAI